MEPRKRFRPKGGYKPGKATKRTASPGNDAAGLNTRRLGANEYVLLEPEAAMDRIEDIQEVHVMMQADELDIARDELLYLVADCKGFLEAHNLLGMLAIEEGDIPLARGHFGFAYESGLASLPKDFSGRLPWEKEYNSHFFDAGRGLARCLVAIGKVDEAREVLEKLTAFDPSEPNVAALLAELNEPPAPEGKSPCAES